MRVKALTNDFSTKSTDLKQQNPRDLAPLKPPFTRQGLTLGDKGLFCQANTSSFPFLQFPEVLFGKTLKAFYLEGFANAFPFGTGTDGVLKCGLSEWGAGMLDLLIFTTFVSITWQSICIIVTTSVLALSPCCHSVPKNLRR